MLRSSFVGPGKGNIFGVRMGDTTLVPLAADGPRSDVYALGAMTYEMFANEPPFTGPSSQAIVAKVLTEQPPPLRPKRPTVPTAAEAAILTALQKLPADRASPVAPRDRESRTGRQRRQLLATAPRV